MKLNKVLSVIMVALMLVCTSTNLLAVNLNTLDTTVDPNVSTGMNNFAGPIIGFITNAAMIIAAIIIAVLGVKFMLGSAEEKAEYKKSMMPLLVGAVLVFGATTIANVVISIMK